MPKLRDVADMSLPEVETDGPPLKVLVDALIQEPSPEVKLALDEALGRIVLQLD